MSDPNTIPPAPMATGAHPWWTQWDPNQVILNDPSVDDAWKTCVLQGVYFGDNEYNGNLGTRIGAVFVILVTSAFVTLFPVIASKVKRLNIPRIIYQIAKNFGTGVIITTGFIHLMDPAYGEIGGTSCVAMTGQWALYSWCPAIMLASAIGVFLVDVYCDFMVRHKYGEHSHTHEDVAGILAGEIHLHGEEDHHNADCADESGNGTVEEKQKGSDVAFEQESVAEQERDFYTQFGAFMILEFGVVFHSVMIGLTLGTTSDFGTLFAVIVFHQCFEGLGVGSRLSMIPFPKEKWWWPYALCIAYALATPLATAIGIGVRTSYRDSSYNALVVSGVFDAMSAGILLYTGFVELVARDFIFAPNRDTNIWKLNLQLFCLLLGAGLMALLGKWA